MKQVHFIEDVSLIKNENYVLSRDKINTDFKGSIFSLKKENDETKSLRSSLEKRLKEELPTVVDISSLSKEEEEKIKIIAKKYNCDPIYHKSAKDFKLKINSIDSTIDLDIIGDIHGLYNDFLEMMEILNYDKEGNHPENKKMLFLGDIIDRGPDSIKMIRLVKKLVKNGHFALKGNHEEQLIENIKRYKDNKNPEGSYAALKTFKEIINEKDLDELYSFLKELKTYFIQDNLAFCHGDLRIFDPTQTTNKEFIYGVTTGHRNTLNNGDEDYQENFNKGINKYTLIRGHQRGRNIFKNVFSLEYQQSFAGNLAALSVSTYKKTKSFEKALILKKCSFNFKNVKKG
jgi:hypothetical protein